MRTRRLTLAAGLATLALAAVASPASAQVNLYQDYLQKGGINPCRFSPGQINQGLKNLPPDLEQYAPDFANQLRSARGACDRGGGGKAPIVPVPFLPGGGGTPPAATVKIGKPPTPKVNRRTKLAGVAPPVVSQKPTGGDSPGWIVPVLALITLIGAALLVLQRRGAGGVEGFRAALSEAGGRASDAAAFLRDLPRYGR